MSVGTQSGGRVGKREAEPTGMAAKRFHLHPFALSSPSLLPFSAKAFLRFCRPLPNSILAAKGNWDGMGWEMLFARLNESIDGRGTETKRAPQNMKHEVCLSRLRGWENGPVRLSGLHNISRISSAVLYLSYFYCYFTFCLLIIIYIYYSKLTNYIFNLLIL